MSGTASRFQGRFGYAPGMTPGNYLPAMPSLLPSVQPPPQAPGMSAQQPTPVSAGSTPAQQAAQEQRSAMSADGAGQQPDAGYGAPAGFGGPSGMGVSYGTVGGALGGLAGMAMGVPGLGVVGSALGTLADVNTYNDQLSAMGLAPSVSFGPAFGNNMSFGFMGQSAQAQAADAAGMTPDGMAAIGSINDAISAGFGPESAGYGSPGEAGGLGDAPGGFGATDSSTNGGYGGESQFMRGGYTGQGHPAEPAGTVHRGEVVIPAHMVARYGLGPLMALVQGEVPPSRLAQLARGD